MFSTKNTLANLNVYIKEVIITISLLSHKGKMVLFELNSNWTFINALCKF